MTPEMKNGYGIINALSLVRLDKAINFVEGLIRRISA